MNKARILIVDDDAELCEEMAELLNSAGYMVDVTTDGRKGIDLLKASRYALVILDFKMSGLTGIEALRQIRELPLPPPVLFVSGKPFVEKELGEEKLSGLIGGMVSKPFDSELLLQKVKSLISPNPHATP